MGGRVGGRVGERVVGWLGVRRSVGGSAGRCQSGWVGGWSASAHEAAAPESERGCPRECGVVWCCWETGNSVAGHGRGGRARVIVNQFPKLHC